MFFERTDFLSAIKHDLASGNPVRIGDGCATVTGYKLPQPLASHEAGKAGARFQARSQDTDRFVLVRLGKVEG